MSRLNRCVINYDRVVVVVDDDDDDDDDGDCRLIHFQRSAPIVKL